MSSRRRISQVNKTEEKKKKEKGILMLVGFPVVVESEIIEKKKERKGRIFWVGGMIVCCWSENKNQLLCERNVLNRTLKDCSYYDEQALLLIPLRSFCFLLVSLDVPYRSSSRFFWFFINALADDAADTRTSSEAIQTALNDWYQALEHYGMKINTTKTEVMAVSRVNPNFQISLGNEEIPQVNSMKYLGVEFHSDGKIEHEITVRIAKYAKNLGLLYPLLRKTSIPRKVKVLFYKTILRPILTYGSEAWTTTTQIRSRMQAAEMRCLRLIFGVTRRDKIRNESSETRWVLKTSMTLLEETSFVGLVTWRGCNRTEFLLSR